MVTSGLFANADNAELIAETSIQLFEDYRATSVYMSLATGHQMIASDAKSRCLRSSLCVLIMSILTFWNFRCTHYSADRNFRTEII
jgi:hypothetical protein